MYSVSVTGPCSAVKPAAWRFSIVPTYSDSFITSSVLRAVSYTHLYLNTRPSFVAEEIFSIIKERIESEVEYFAMPHQSYYVNMRFVDDYDKKEVKMSYGKKTYTAIMTRNRYKAFNDKMFEMAKLL